MMESGAQVLSLVGVKTLDQGPVPLYVLLLPEVSDHASGVALPEVQVLAIPVLAGRDGLLLAIPADSFPPEVIYPQESPPPRALIGPAKRFLFMPLQTTMLVWKGFWIIRSNVCWWTSTQLSCPVELRGLDPVTGGPGIHCFSEGDLEVYPSSPELLSAAYAWFLEEQEANQSPQAAKAGQTRPKQIVSAAGHLDRDQTSPVFIPCGYAAPAGSVGAVPGSSPSCLQLRTVRILDF